MVKWSYAKKRPHDLSGVINPDAWWWQIIDGVYYPFDEGSEGVEEWNVRLMIKGAMFEAQRLSGVNDTDKRNEEIKFAMYLLHKYNPDLTQIIHYRNERKLFESRNRKSFNFIELEK